MSPTKQIATWWNRYIVYDPHLNQPKAPLSKDERVMAACFVAWGICACIMAVAVFNMLMISAQLQDLAHHNAIARTHQDPHP